MSKKEITSSKKIKEKKNVCSNCENKTIDLVVCEKCHMFFCINCCKQCSRPNCNVIECDDCMHVEGDNYNICCFCLDQIVYDIMDREKTIHKSMVRESNATKNGLPGELSNRKIK
jgi:hypothetical protein